MLVKKVIISPASLFLLILNRAVADLEVTQGEGGEFPKIKLQFKNVLI